MKLSFITEKFKIYDKIEIKVDLDSDLSGLNVFDENDVDLSILLTSEGGKEIAMPGFYYEDWEFDEGLAVIGEAAKSSDFRLRFSLPEVSLWKYEVTLKIKGEIKEKACGELQTVENPDNHGYLGAEPQNKIAFVFSDGTTFSAIGENHAFTINDSTKTTRAQKMIYWMEKAAAVGSNFTRLWSYQWCLGIQTQGDAPSNLSGGMMNAAQIDRIVEAWERIGMYGQLCLFSFNQLNNSEGSCEAAWGIFPYNKAAGGYLDKPIEFFTDARAIRDTKLFLRYLIARYGYSTNIFAWEYFNEADGISGATQHVDEVVNWHIEMTDYIRSVDPYRHMVTTSTACRPCNADKNDAELKNRLNALEIFDFASLHTYNYTDISQMADFQLFFLKHYRRPTMFGECGIMSAGEGRGLDQNLITFHHQNWIGMMSGGAGTCATWYWETLDKFDGYYQFKPLRIMADAIPWDEPSIRVVTKDNIELSDSLVNTYGYIGENCAYLWLYDVEYKHNKCEICLNARDVSGIRISIPLADGCYEISWLDTYSGELSSKETLSAKDGMLNITAPTFNKDIAVIITRA